MKTLDIKKSNQNTDTLEHHNNHDLEIIELKSESASPNAGWGACSACSCKGFRKSFWDKDICKCDHHRSTHR